jgi:uncharacterized heparinase superfamily protein
VLPEVPAQRWVKRGLMERSVFSTGRRNWVFFRQLRSQQVLRRIQLQLLRRWRVCRVPRDEPPDASAALRQDLPTALMPPRRGLERLQDDRWRFTFLNQSREFNWPIDWDLRDAEPQDQLWKMNLHYMEYLESVTDADFSRIVDHWIAKNRPYRPGYWHDVWNSYTTSLRVVVWLQQLADRRERLAPALVARMASSLVEQIDFLHRHLETDLRGNHLIKNIKALLWGARCFDLPSVQQWRRTAHDLLTVELEDQILADGVHYERSPSYHCQVFADLIESYLVIEDDRLRQWLGAVLARMAAATADLVHPDGGVALFNDSGLNMAYPPEACMAAYREMGGQAVSDSGAICRADAGFFGVRTQDFYVIVDCGPIGPDFLVAHGHGDILSFEWSAAGKRIVVDPGVFEYASGPRRAYSRSTRSHNTVTVAEAEQAEFFGAFRCGRRPRAAVLACEPTANEGLVLEGTHDGFDHLPGRPRHVRRFVMSPRTKSIDIFDRIEGDGSKAAVVRLLLHPACMLELAGARAVVRRDEVTVEVVAERSIRCEQAHWSPDMGLWLQTRRLTIRFENTHRLSLRVRPKGHRS